MPEDMGVAPKGDATPGAIATGVRTCASGTAQHDATERRQLSKYSWLFALDARLNDVMQTLVNHLGVEHHSFTVTELKSGEGLAYDADKRVVCEYYAKAWME